MIDNVVLVLLSLKESIGAYLDDNGWKDKYNLFLAGDPNLQNKEVVLRATNKSKQVELPLITIELGFIRSDMEELGGVPNEVVTTSILVRAVDAIQLFSLSNMIRKYLTDLHFDIYDFNSPLKEVVGKADSYDTTLDDLSDADAPAIGEKYVTLINTTLEYTSQELT